MITFFVFITYDTWNSAKKDPTLELKFTRIIIQLWESVFQFYPKTVRHYLPVAFTATVASILARMWSKLIILSVLCVRSAVLNREQKCLSSGTEYLFLNKICFIISVLYAKFSVLTFRLCLLMDYNSSWNMKHIRQGMLWKCGCDLRSSLFISLLYLSQRDISPQIIKIYAVHTPTIALFINLDKSFKLTLKYTIISLLHVSVFTDHNQGALSVPN